ncbi:MAG: No hits, partial [uncultured Sulfurovum sp.]
MFKRIILLGILFASMLSAATVSTDKDTYSTNQQIVVTYSEMEGLNHDWIGIYPTGSSNDWGNQVRWDWTGDKEQGVATFAPLAAGTYEVRLFYNNSFTTQVSKEITVDANGAVTTVTTSKEVYLPEEPISAIFNNMSGDNQDWIAIYPKGSTSDWGNQIDWKWMEGDISGER